MTVRELITALEAIAAEQGDAAPVYYDDPARSPAPILVQAGWARVDRRGSVRADAPRWLAEANAQIENGNREVSPCALIGVPDEDRRKPRIRLKWLTMGDLKMRARKARASRAVWGAWDPRSA
jgi:hypothetical protein